MNEKKKIMSLSVEPEMHILLKKSSKKMGWSTSQLVRELVSKYLDLVVQDEETIPVILRIPAEYKENPEKLKQWLTIKVEAIHKALT
ncbi:MAG: hypothetical protein ACXADB_07970 [Candidatus Hermodarchaeia archaeon]|jgi:hypothetical protein